MDKKKIDIQENVIDTDIFLPDENSVKITYRAEENKAFNPHRKAISEQDNEIICQCEHITKAEIMEAIRRGASTVDSVKRRAGSGMGRCQGSRCCFEIQKLLEAYSHGSL